MRHELVVARLDHRGGVVHLLPGRLFGTDKRASLVEQGIEFFYFSIAVDVAHCLALFRHCGQLLVLVVEFHELGGVNVSLLQLLYSRRKLFDSRARGDVLRGVLSVQVDERLKLVGRRAHLRYVVILNALGSQASVHLELGNAPRYARNVGRREYSPGRAALVGEAGILYHEAYVLVLSAKVDLRRGVRHFVCYIHGEALGKLCDFRPR